MVAAATNHAQNLVRVMRYSIPIHRLCWQPESTTKVPPLSLVPIMEVLETNLEYACLGGLQLSSAFLLLQCSGSG